MAYVPSMKSGRVTYTKCKDILKAPKDAVYVKDSKEMEAYLQQVYPAPEGAERIDQSYEAEFMMHPEGIISIPYGSKLTNADIARLCKEGWKLKHHYRHEVKDFWPYGLVLSGCYMVYDPKRAKALLRRLESYNRSKLKRDGGVDRWEIARLQNILKAFSLTDHPKFEQVGFRNTYRGFDCGSTIEGYMVYTVRLAKTAEWVWRRPVWRTHRPFKSAMKKMMKGVPFLPKRNVYSEHWEPGELRKHPAMVFCKWFMKEYAVMFPEDKEQLRYMRLEFRHSMAWLTAKLTAIQQKAKEAQCSSEKNSKAKT